MWPRCNTTARHMCSITHIPPQFVKYSQKHLQITMCNNQANSKKNSKVSKRANTYANPFDLIPSSSSSSLLLLVWVFICIVDGLDGLGKVHPLHSCCKCSYQHRISATCCGDRVTGWGFSTFNMFDNKHTSIRPQPYDHTTALPTTISTHHQVPPQPAVQMPMQVAPSHWSPHM